MNASTAIFPLRRPAYLFSAIIVLHLMLFAVVIQAQAAEGVMKDTTVAPGAVSDPVQPTAPYSNPREHKPAHTVMTGENPAAPSVDVINYASSVVEKSGNNLLVLQCVLSKPEDRATLDRLADKIYSDNKGYNYDTVSIRWHVGSNPQQAGLWATTNMTKTGSTFDYAK